MEGKIKNNQQNHISCELYDKLVKNQTQLTAYLKYIRYRPQPSKIQLSIPRYNAFTKPKEQNKDKKPVIEIKPYIQQYLKLVKQAVGMENYSQKKIIRKLIQYLQQFPTMGFLIETVNSFGKEKKKLVLSQSFILSQVNDQMILLFTKVIEKIQSLKKQAQSKKLMQLGQRISHLNKLVEITNKNPKYSQMKVIGDERVQKYLLMQQNIEKAQKNFGCFSQSFLKNKDTFSNINKVYQQIVKHEKVNLS